MEVNFSNNKTSNMELQKLVETLDAQDKVKKDFLAGMGNLHFVNGNLIMTHAGQTLEFKPSTIFHQQVSEKLGIPKGYYDRMKDKAMDLLDKNVNHWLSSEGKNILIRAFVNEDGNNTARALLSDRYNMIDNMEVLMQTLQAIKESGVRVDVKEADLSETRMYLKVVAPEIEVKATELLKLYRRSIEAGTGIISGFITQNSEVGYGSFQTAARAVVLACNNGMVNTKDMMRRVHLGGKLDELDFHKSDAIRNANRKLVKEQIKHAVSRFLSKDYLENFVKELTVMGDKKIEAPITQVFEVVGKNYGFNEEDKANLLDHFLKGGDNRRIGVVNAVTELCQTFEDVDKKNDTEAVGVEILQNFDTIEAAAIKIARSAN